jgi:N-dimethylarginine dimethylaminohydrolase
MTDPSKLAAYGGPGWRPRETVTREELGSIWAPCGLDSEWLPLKFVLLHRPGREMEAVLENPQENLMLAEPKADAMGGEHDGLAQLYRAKGVEVSYVQPPTAPPPNQLFAADLFVMTPEGAILGRPASRVRAGEERWVARALADIGVPILRSVRGGGTFEGADLMWLGSESALVGQGIRTNAEGVRQVCSALQELGIGSTVTQLPPGTMHLMGQLRIVDRDLALAWPGRLPPDAVEALEAHGFQVRFVPDEGEAILGSALNFVVLGPREIVMPTGNPVSQDFYENLGIACRTVEVGEIGKAAGSIACMTGILERERAEGAS